MADVTYHPKRFTVSYDPSFRPGSGLVNTLSWHGTLKQMISMFEGCEANGERLLGLVVDEQGITIYFERIHAAAASKGTNDE